MTSVNEPLRGGALPGVSYQNAAYLAERYGPAYRWLVTITGMVGVVSMVLAMTTVNVAVPDVMGAFGIGQDKAQWMSSAYMATMTAGMLLNAWMSGVLGERRTFIGALFFFSAGALLGGMAPNEDVLIFARILQGFSAGIAQPLVMATIFTVFPAERRGSAMGIFGLGVVFAPAIGPTLGGLMIEYFSWRYVFYISLPFCGIAALMGAFFMPTRPLAREIPPFDWLGFALLCVGLWGLMTGIADGQREGWSSDVIVFRLVLGTLSAGSAFSAVALRLGLMKPRPSRETITMPTNVQNVVSASAVTIRANPAANSIRPPMIMNEAGIASERRPASGKMKASISPAGIIIRPASSGVNPIMVWTNTGMT